MCTKAQSEQLVIQTLFDSNEDANYFGRRSKWWGRVFGIRNICLEIRVEIAQIWFSLKDSCLFFWHRYMLRNTVEIRAGNPQVAKVLSVDQFSRMYFVEELQQSEHHVQDGPMLQVHHCEVEHLQER